MRDFSLVQSNSEHLMCAQKILIANFTFQLHFSFIFSYGDRAPRSVLARTFAFIWVLIGLVIISIFTATVTTSLTAISLSNEIKLYGSDVSRL